MGKNLKTKKIINHEPCCEARLLPVTIAEKEKEIEQLKSKLGKPILIVSEETMMDPLSDKRMFNELGMFI